MQANESYHSHDSTRSSCEDTQIQTLQIDWFPISRERMTGNAWIIVLHHWRSYSLLLILGACHRRPSNVMLQKKCLAWFSLFHPKVSHLGFEILRNFAEILRSVAILRSRFCRDLEKFAVNLRSQKNFAVPTSKFF
jgi:hypothetical protein